jgi:hypothetical protein
LFTEEIFGWMKMFGGLRRSCFIGIAKTQFAAYLYRAIHNLRGMARLAPLSQ